MALFFFFFLEGGGGGGGGGGGWMSLLSSIVVIQKYCYCVLMFYTNAKFLNYLKWLGQDLIAKKFLFNCQRSYI